MASVKKKNCAIFDLDGTLSNSDKRITFIKTKPKNWLAFYKGLIVDPPVKPVVDFLIATSKNMDILLLTGRPERYRELTTQWLTQHALSPYVTDLYMRADNDNRTDYIVKMEIADKIEQNYKINFVVEDRLTVVEAWKNRGIFVFDVNQNSHDNKGDF